MNRLPLYLILFFPLTIIAQSLNPLVVDIIPGEGGKALAYPNLGNLVAPQFSETDLNGDGIKDLFVFDRNGNIVLPFIKNQNDSYDFLPVYNSAFPKSLHSWALIRDYNNDGVGDIFTAPTVPGIPGIEVWKGNLTEDGLQYELVEFNINNFNALQYRSGSTWVIIYVAFTDVPGIEDLDGDGDLDIVTFDPAGSLASLYRNYSVEEGFGLDTFIMRVEDFCWGKFREDEFSSSISLSDDASSCAPAARSTGVLRHSGSTLSFPDVDRDGVYDLFLGDLTAEGIAFLHNGGSSSEAWMTSFELAFPQYDVPIGVSAFISTFLVDINGDGYKDIIAAPNGRLNPPTQDNVWLYYDQGGDTAKYELVKKNYLIDQSVLLGNNTHPCLMDTDLDGDMDLLVGSTGLLGMGGKTKSTIFHFENQSNESSVSFVLTEDNYLNIQALNPEVGRYAPAAGDLDGDADIDLIIGDSDGRLIYYENIAKANQAPVFADYQYNYFEIHVGQNAKPQIIDLDGDGLQDLVVGERNDNKEGDILGGLNYFKNMGSTGQPLFDPSGDTPGNTSVLGGIFTRDQGYPVGSSSPAFVNGVDDLFGFIGSESGQLKLYQNIIANLYGRADLVVDDLLPYRLGNNSTPIAGDINGNDFVDLVVGSSRGSLSFFETNIKFDGTTSTSINFEPQITIYPNPSFGQFNIKSDFQIERIMVFDLKGKLVMDTSAHRFTISQTGLYLANIVTEKGNKMIKLIVTE